MIIDHESNKSNGDKIIEVLTSDGKVSVWVPVMATDLMLMTKNRELVRIKEIRVRNLKEEKDE